MSPNTQGSAFSITLEKLAYQALCGNGPEYPVDQFKATIEKKLNELELLLYRVPCGTYSYSDNRYSDTRYADNGVRIKRRESRSRKRIMTWWRPNCLHRCSPPPPHRSPSVDHNRRHPPTSPPQRLHPAHNRPGHTPSCRRPPPLPLYLVHLTRCTGHPVAHHHHRPATSPPQCLHPAHYRHGHPPSCRHPTSTTMAVLFGHLSTAAHPSVNRLCRPHSTIAAACPQPK